MESMTMDHAAVSVANLERSRQFWGDVLGFTIVEDAFELSKFEIRGVVLRNGAGARVELFERKGSQPSPPGHPTDSTLRQGWFQFALAVSDVRATYARVVSHGATGLKEPFLAPDGRAVVAFISDPDGNLIEFVQRPMN